MWRLAPKRDQRTSPLSILIIILAVSDFVYCIHLLLLEILIAKFHLDQQKNGERSSSIYVCFVSGCLSLLSCCTAQWTTFNIAVYSFQTLSEWCSRCCCSLLRKRNLLIAITCQVLVPVLFILCHYFLNFPSAFPQPSSDIFANNTIYSNFSTSVLISLIFEQCAWAQSNGIGYCDNMTESVNYNLSYYENDCSLLYDGSIGTIIALFNTVLTLACGILYMLLCLKIRNAASQVNVTERSDINKLQWRLSVIVLLNTLCWIPVTALHWIGFFYYPWRNDLTATNILLISISPAANPLIYTFTEKNFLHSIRKYWRLMNCDISLRQNNSNYNDDHITGVERCSCIPCVRCVHRDEDYWNTEDTSVWISEQSRLLPSVNDSKEAT